MSGTELPSGRAQSTAERPPMAGRSEGSPVASLIVGSASDAEAMAACRKALDTLGIPHEARVLSAHRTPNELVAYVEALESRGFKIIIAAAGMAAHLPGVVAAHTRLPVLGVPLVSGSLAGVDALLSIAQMPSGVPVGCLGVGSAGAKNAAYLAARMLALFDDRVRARLLQVTKEDHDRVLGAAMPEKY